jgi:hypothetical protein
MRLENFWKKFMSEKLSQGFDFFGPRTDYKLKNVLSTFNEKCLKKNKLNDPNYDDCTIFWHKLYNYDMIDTNIVLS